MEQILKQRICIEFCVKLQISASETFKMLNKAFPNDAPKITTVFEWHSRFKAGRISIEDDPRQGRPKFQRTDENLEQDRGISKTTIGRIVTEDLKLKKTPAKFIPRFLTNEQKLCRLATCEDMMEMTRTDPEWKDKIITGDETWVYGYDPETKPQSAEWREHLMTSFLAKNGTQILLQPPYFPDIAPNDFFLFPKLKAVLKGRHFDTRDDIIEKSPLALKSIPKEAYKNCSDNWEKRWRCPNSPFPVFSSSANNPLYDESEDATQKDIELDDSDSDNYGEQECPKRFSQPKLNDLTLDLRLSKQDAELLASRLKEMSKLEDDVNVTFYRTGETLGVNMSIKVHYLHSYLDKFPDNLGAYSDEHGERFYQDMKVMEERYQGVWDCHMMAHYCWNLSLPEYTYKRKSKRLKFMKD
ncbi:hypothetical protein LAZ67_3002365 [Cordylochernes scorpioides]|uniref:Mos1 transposase HTH domain-containing protein n=1 Tax=Cordylochernes scorpioides TaxID=51811 RepID=A0ABY6K9I1_9ARAC|nr:hypothetical protein LAZ67_3002365 [Cordylochernes scorpioides]